MASLGYRRILVPVIDNPESERATRVACRLAAERRASITAITVIEVPPLLPLDAHMTEEEAEARLLLDQAAAVADSYGVSILARIVRARDAASAIVDEANANHSEMLVIGAARKTRSSAHAPIFGRAVQHVLKRAPCRVMVIAATPAGARAAPDESLIPAV